MEVLAGEHESVGLNLGADSAAGLGVGDRDRGSGEKKGNRGGIKHQFGTLVMAFQIF